MLTCTSCDISSEPDVFDISMEIIAEGESWWSNDSGDFVIHVEGGSVTVVCAEGTAYGTSGWDNGNGVDFTFRIVQFEDIRRYLGNLDVTEVKNGDWHKVSLVLEDSATSLNVVYRDVEIKRIDPQ